MGGTNPMPIMSKPLNILTMQMGWQLKILTLQMVWQLTLEEWLKNQPMQVDEKKRWWDLPPALGHPTNSTIVGDAGRVATQVGWAMCESPPELHVGKYSIWEFMGGAKACPTPAHLRMVKIYIEPMPDLFNLVIRVFGVHFSFLRQAHLVSNFTNFNSGPFFIPLYKYIYFFIGYLRLNRIWILFSPKCMFKRVKAQPKLNFHKGQHMMARACASPSCT